MKKNSKLKKTVKIGKKRYKKSKPSDLFTALVYCNEYDRDENGDEIDSSQEVTVSLRLCSLQEVIKLINNYDGNDNSFDGDSAWFESEHNETTTREGASFTEYQYCVLVCGSNKAISKLESVVDPKAKQRRKRQEKDQLKRDVEFERRNKIRLISTNDNIWMPRRSTANLSLVG